ncbi:UNVERIFIED_CONTAM: hypothetical protein Slati_0022700 [Sesamum latifolium]|uniref:Uncharacterized protein n=1 Tax=Sesamum latifolium TaxID=2727402 RepID=A0AAW2Y6A2_9LAMI
MKVASPEASPKGVNKATPGDRAESSDPPCKGVTQMIAGGPIGGDSHHARKLQVREAHDITTKEVLDVEAMEDTPLIQFGRAERSGPKASHNDALVITALLANYEVGRIFIDSRSSAYILFGEAYDQMQLGDIPLEKVNTSLYGFAGEVVHHWGMISLSLTLETGGTRRTCMLKFLKFKETPSNHANVTYWLYTKNKKGVRTKPSRGTLQQARKDVEPEEEPEGGGEYPLKFNQLKNC